jgi:hypothetical protein
MKLHSEVPAFIIHPDGVGDNDELHRAANPRHYTTLF